MAQLNVPAPSPTGPRPNSTGTLKMSIVLGKNPSVIGSSNPFYLIGPETQIDDSELTGAVNLLEHHGLDSSYQKLCTAKKVKDELSSFLPDLPGYLDTPATEDGSSLRQLYEAPPRVRKELDPLPATLLNAFRLQPGAVPEQYRYMDANLMKKLHKKKRKKEEAEEPDNGEAKRSRAEKDEERRRKKEKKRKREKQEHGM